MYIYTRIYRSIQVKATTIMYWYIHIYYEWFHCYACQRRNQYFQTEGNLIWNWTYKSFYYDWFRVEVIFWAFNILMFLIFWDINVILIKNMFDYCFELCKQLKFLRSVLDTLSWLIVGENKEVHKFPVNYCWS